MKNNFILERLSGSNFGHFLELIEKLAEYEKLDPPDKKAKQRLKKDGLGANPKFEAYLAKNNGAYVGYIIFFTTYSSFLGLPTFFLEDLFISTEHRKNGFGQKMLDFCIKEAKKRKCGRLDLNVLKWNKSAIKFYEKNKMECMDWKIFRLNLAQ